jgi:pyrimidine-nucleoside phosphorylase
MRAVDLILKKKRGEELTADEIQHVVGGFVRGEVPDYQMAALMMAVCFRGMSDAETAELTRVMLHSGQTIPLDGVRGPCVDKHSTGGVGDKTTLVLAPLVASCGLVVAKMSGRGLGHTGGTLDKLEALEGFRVDLGRQEFLSTVNEHGLAVISQTGDLVPADKKMYALRDVTGTVDNVSLIAASIMSKKLAVANEALVLDVKVGSGAFMKTMPEAEALASCMVRIGTRMGRKVRAVITDMDQPLGVTVGNAMEVEEAIQTLSGRGPADLVDVVLALAAQLLVMTGRAPGEEEARGALARKLASGEAFDRFTRFVMAQGGVRGCWERLPRARHTERFVAPAGGVLAGVDCEAVGMAAMKLGAGRETKDSTLDLAAGLRVLRRLGDNVAPGDPLAELHYNDPLRAAAARSELVRAFRVVPGGSAVSVPPHVHRVVSG